MADPVFIVGTGRSGTHWLARTLAAHPDTRVSIEEKPLFTWVTQAALFPNRRWYLLPAIIAGYRFQTLRPGPPVYVDKSHPNVWMAEELARAFPRAKFVGIRRDALPTVASMMKVQTVRRWGERYREFPVPNSFLGLSEANLDEYAAMPLVGRCAMRWASHEGELARLQDVLGDRFTLVEYESLMFDTQATLHGIETFLGLRSPIETPPIQHESAEKWKRNLSESDQQLVRDVVQRHFGITLPTPE